MKRLIIAISVILVSTVLFTIPVLTVEAEQELPKLKMDNLQDVLKILVPKEKQEQEGLEEELEVEQPQPLQQPEKLRAKLEEQIQQKEQEEGADTEFRARGKLKWLKVRKGGQQITFGVSSSDTFIAGGKEYNIGAESLKFFLEDDPNQVWLDMLMDAFKNNWTVDVGFVFIQSNIYGPLRVKELGVVR
ncbi:MAG: hypothetical protein ACYSRP_03700 [Planctomycetota bacterium]